MNQINKILIDTFSVSENEVEESLTMEDVDSWDSITHMSLIVNLEDELKIELSGDDIAEMTSFDAIRTIVAKYL